VKSLATTIDDRSQNDKRSPPKPSTQRTGGKRKISEDSQVPTNDAIPAAAARLARYGVNLVDKVRMGHPVVGRDTEIARLQEILERSSGYCPVLIGKAGVGKTAIIVGLAQRMACEDVSENFPTQLWALDTNLIIKAMEDESLCEDFLKAIQEAESAMVPPILFIDDLHEILARVPSAKSSNAASRVAKAVLLGKFRCIGATTPANHRLHFVKSSIGQRFQQLHVREASTHTTAKIIQAMRPMLEGKRHVRLDDSAIKAAVTLASDHMPDAVLPSSAIELLNSACEIARNGKRSPSSIASSDFMSPPPSPPCSLYASDDDEDKYQMMNEASNFAVVPSSAGPVPNIDTTSKDLLRSQQSSRLISTGNSTNVSSPLPQISHKANYLLRTTKCGNTNTLNSGMVESGKRRAVVNSDSMSCLTRMVATANVGGDESDCDSDDDSDVQDEDNVMDMRWDGNAPVSAVHVRAALAAIVGSA